MLTSQEPEDAPKEKKVARWTYEPVRCGTQQVGFLAGGYVGAYNHYKNRQSYVCRRKMSNMTLQCEDCAMGLVPEWRGYVPWYDREYTNRFSLITEEYREAFREIPLHAQIELSRGKDPTCPCVIRQKNWRLTPLPMTPERERKVNLMPFLVGVLWKDEALKRYANGMVPAPTLPFEEKQEKGPVQFPFDKLADAFVHQAEDAAAREAAAKENVNLLHKLKERSTNGHATKPKKSE